MQQPERSRPIVQAKGAARFSSGMREARASRQAGPNRRSCWQILGRVGRGILLVLAWIIRAFLIIVTVFFLATHAYPLLIIALILTAIAFALVRSRLINFSLFVNRSIVYSILTLSLTGIYFLGIAFYQLGAHHSIDPRGDNSEVAGVISTLLMVALFQPLRKNLQKWIDRRFYRQGYDAERVIAAFTSAVREEIDLDQLNVLLISTINETLLPQSIELWVREAASDAGQTGLWLLLWQQREDRRSPTMQLEQEMKAEPQYRIEIEADDSLLKKLLEQGEITELRQTNQASTLAQVLKKREARLALPLVSRGELVGLLSLGERLSGQKYGPYDQNLLIMLAGQAAPALRIAQLVMEQQAQALENERIEQELRTARFIQQALLPKDVPDLYGWQIATYYQPAREVGGDFYDFHLMPDGRTSILIGDVTGKGIPAALFMTTTCTMLRSVAKEISTPGEILAHVNELLYSNIPEGMFVTCFYAILDPGSGELCYANAGHDLPYRNCKGQADEVLATGMPLGLLPGMRYEEKIVTITQGETLLFYSDGLVEAHNPRREMFGLPRLAQLMTESREHAVLIDELLKSLKSFTREGWEQEDDVTLVTLHRTAFAQAEQEQAGMSKSAQETGDEELVKLAEWSLASVVGNERPVMERIGEIVRPLKLEAEKLANLETAVAEAVMNAMEHGNHYQEEKRVTIQVFMTGRAIIVRIHDEGTEQLPATGSSPDLAAKLAGQQTPRGWGLFLIENLVDELHSHPEPPGYIELIMYRQAE